MSLGRSSKLRTRRSPRNCWGIPAFDAQPPRGLFTKRSPHTLRHPRCSPKRARPFPATPLVTCLCLTRNRRQWIPKAIESFLAQTYRNKELLILADGERVRDLIPDNRSIRIIEIEEGYTIGPKRNFGVLRSLGEIIAHWDDDDYSAPGRLDDQVGRLLSSQVAVTGYRSMRFTDGTSWWLYRGAENYSLGTSLCYRRDWALAHQFPSLQIGEDNEFGKIAAETGQMISIDAGELMHAAIHTGNTSPKNTDWMHPL